MPSKVLQLKVIVTNWIFHLYVIEIDDENAPQYFDCFIPVRVLFSGIILLYNTYNNHFQLKLFLSFK